MIWRRRWRERSVFMSSEVSASRLSAALLILGAIIGLVANGLHPHSVDSDPAATMRSIAASEIWIPIHVGIIGAMLLVTGGVIEFARGFTQGLSAALARLGTVAALIGTTLVCVSTSLDGFARKALAVAWANASTSDAPMAFQVAHGARTIDDGLWTLGILAFFGLTFLCYGTAALVAGGLPGWIGWGAIASALGSLVAAGLRIASNGEVQAAETTFLVSSLLITVWALLLGVRLWRGTSAVASSRPAVAHASTP
jgi:hypothetical protein